MNPEKKFSPKDVSSRVKKAALIISLSLVALSISSVGIASISGYFSLTKPAKRFAFSIIISYMYNFFIDGLAIFAASS